MGERDQPTEEVEGLLRETERQRETITVDPSKDHYPMCIVWSPIPVLSYVTPIIGHTGIALSDGTIKDFGGSYYIHTSKRRTAFGNVVKYIEVKPEETNIRSINEWDDAIQAASEHFSKTCHNVVANNCHDHVCEVLNKVQYKGKNNWNNVSLVLSLCAHSKYVSTHRLIYNWLPFTIIVLFVIGM